MAPPSSYLAVLKAAYDYTPDSEDEIAIKEDQILFLIERTDDDWWRVKAKDADETNEGGLVPSAYVEPAAHKSVVKALYDYDASAPGELSVKEDDVLLAFGADDGWLLVQTEKNGGMAGFVPENYVEASDGEAAGEAEQEAEEEEETVAPAAPAPAIIVPPSPPRPSAPYVDPAERVAASHAKAQSDSIQTWAVSEVDKKGKKKKGTLGIGNGAVFFASESDKTPVQKWPTIDVDASYIEKSKHVHIEILGATPINLHFNAGSKDVADAIIDKLDASKAASKASAGAPAEDEEPDASATEGSPKSKKNGVSVHFATTPPSIISPREHEVDSEPEDYINSKGLSHDDGNEWVTVLYDFTADGDDELSVQEGDHLVVLEKDGDEWWKVRDSLGHEGVVPASYVELEEKSGSAGTNGSTNGYDEDAAAAKEAADREEEEERERKRKEAERKRVDAERKSRAVSEAAEADRRRKERERERKMKEEDERRAREKEEEEERSIATLASRQSRPVSASGSRSRPSEDRGAGSPPRESKARASSDKARGPPAPQRVRTWHDRTGQFKVEAEFLGFSNGKLRLHKTNGVVIEVPMEKMSPEDMKFLEKMKGGKEKAQSASRAMSPSGSDDEPLAVRRRSLQPESRPRPVPPKKTPTVDWFEFFLNAGCDVDDCTRYAASFERDKIDEAILPDITQQTMRSLGLREGDIIRVTKAIAQRVPGGRTSALDEQLKKDEELARKLQEEEGGGRSTPKRQTTSPGLFAGPGGVLKNNTRRGRPQPSKSTPPATVDLQSITTASTQIARTDSPLTARVGSPSSAVSGPPRASSAAPAISGFDDDAWTNRPSSTQPLAPTPAVATRAPSAPPVQSPPAQVQSPPAVTAPPPAPAPPAVPVVATPTGLARTTESDVFEQLARLSALKTQSPATSSPAPVSAPPSAISPPIVTPPAGYQNGMGMGSSLAPLGHLQSQVTGFPQQNGPRGPFAPVPANQSLLQPLIPTTTGFNSFVPTRPSSNPPTFNPPTYNSPSPQPSFLNSQPTGYPGALASQATGFPVQNMQSSGFSGGINGQPSGFSGINAQPTGFSGGIAPQQTGFPNSGPIMSQTTSYPGAFGAGPFTGGRSFGPLQPNATGFNPGFGQVSSPPPVPPLPTNNSSNNTAPANVFAQMKSGTFGNDSAPQTGNKYDALRPQPTGWGVQGTTTGYQNGYSGPFY